MNKLNIYPYINENIDEKDIEKNKYLITFDFKFNNKSINNLDEQEFFFQNNNAHNNNFSNILNKLIEVLKITDIFEIEFLYNDYLENIIFYSEKNNIKLDLNNEDKNENLNKYTIPFNNNKINLYGFKYKEFNKRIYSIKILFINLNKINNNLIKKLNSNSFYSNWFGNSYDFINKFTDNNFFENISLNHFTKIYKIRVLFDGLNILGFFCFYIKTKNFDYLIKNNLINFQFINNVNNIEIELLNLMHNSLINKILYNTNFLYDNNFIVNPCYIYFRSKNNFYIDLYLKKNDYISSLAYSISNNINSLEFITSKGYYIKIGEKIGKEYYFGNFNNNHILKEIVNSLLIEKNSYFNYWPKYDKIEIKKIKHINEIKYLFIGNIQSNYNNLIQNKLFFSNIYYKRKKFILNLLFCIKYCNNNNNNKIAKTLILFFNKNIKWLIKNLIIYLI